MKQELTSLSAEIAEKYGAPVYLLQSTKYRFSTSSEQWKTDTLVNLICVENEPYSNYRSQT